MADKDYSPFIVWLDSPEESTINLFDDKMASYASIFRELNREGNGYDWAAVARTLNEMIHNFKKGAIRFNPEADMLSIYGPQKRIKILANELQAISQNPLALAKIIQRSEID